MRIYPSIAMFMAFLVVCIPLYVADAYAVTEMNLIKHSGNKNIEGYLETRDILTVHVDASIDGDNVTADQIKLNGYVFTNCGSSFPGYLRCIYTLDSSFRPGTFPVIIKLYDDNGNDLNKDILTDFTIDNIEPIIEFTRIPVQTGKNISIGYSVKDRASDINEVNKCSGIKRIGFYDGASLLKEVLLSSSNVCEYSNNSLLLPVPNSGQITIQAEDQFGQFAAATSGTFNIDITPPEINLNSFEILYNGVELEDYIKGGQFEADISVDVTENNLSIVKIDLSSIGGSSDIDAVCTKHRNIYTCRWNNVGIDIGSTKTADIMITAVDVFTNNASATYTRTFNVDDSAPEITAIRTDYMNDDIYYIGSGMTDITVELSETGSGMSNKDIALDLSEINQAYTISEQADECVQDVNKWICKWFNRTATKAHGSQPEIYVVNAKDDVGNSATGMTSLSMHVDKQIPAAGNVNITAISALGRTDYISSGDDLEISVSASDPIGVVAYANLSNIKNDIGSDKIAGTCTDGVCSWSISSIGSGYLDTSITLNIYDNAGNLNSVEVPVKVYAKEAEEEPDYWSVVSIDKSPKAIDRQTAPLISQRVYFHINLASKAGAEILSLNLGQCSGQTGFLEKYDIFNNVGGVTDPYVYVELKKTDAKVDKVNITCDLQIVSLYNNAISNFEIEHVPLVVSFYNMPLGEVGTEVEKKIDDLKSTWIDGWGKWIGMLNKLFFYANAICNLYYTFTKVVAIFQAVTSLLGISESAAVGTPAYAILHPARAGFCISTEGASGILGFVDFIKEGAGAAGEVAGGAAGDKGPKKPETSGIRSFADKFCGMINCKADPKTAKEGGFGKWSNYLGGGWWFGQADFFSEAAEGLSVWTTQSKFGSASKSSVSDVFNNFVSSSETNVKNSLVLSILSVCLPGIIYNIEKYRQLQCQYIDCLQNGIDTGVPMDACDKVKSYSTCKYIYGEIFQVISFILPFDNTIKKVKDALSNPLTIVGTAIALRCMPLCGVTIEYPHARCRYVKLLSELGDVIQNVMGIKDLFTIKYDYCKEVTSKKESKSNEGGFSF